MSNPRTFTLKRWFAEILKEEYQKHDLIVERISTAITTDQDLKDFGSLITNVYEKAYRKAVEDYRHQAEKMGLKIQIVPSDQTS